MVADGEPDCSVCACGRQLRIVGKYQVLQAPQGPGEHQRVETERVETELGPSSRFSIPKQQRWLFRVNGATGESVCG